MAEVLVLPKIYATSVNFQPSVDFKKKRSSSKKNYRPATKASSLPPIHPGESTNSWHSPGPKRNNSVAAERSTSAVNRLNGNPKNELDTSLDRIRFHALQKRSELNNNHLEKNGTGPATVATTAAPQKAAAKPRVAKKPAAPQPALDLAAMGRAKSETQLLFEDRENRQPYNMDDAPIRPAKNPVYADEYPPSQPLSSGLVKKSTSQHSLPAATNAQRSKKHTFLRSGTGNRVKPTPLSQTAAAINSKSPQSVATGGVAGALKLMSHEEWQDKIDGINQICDLSTSNPGQVGGHIHEICVALLEECKNLRSSVSRVAIATFSTLFAHLKGKMDSEIEKIGAVLMNKSGDVSNAFIRDDANEALEKMVTYGSPMKVLLVLSQAAKSKHVTIRASCGQFLSQLMQRVGYANALNSPEIMGKLIPLIVNLAKDQTPNVRQPAKTTLFQLSQQPGFEEKLRRGCLEADCRSVKDILTHIQKKGGADCLDSTSTSLAGSLSRSGSFKKSAAVQRKLPDNIQLDLDECRKDLTAAGWENRLTGLRKFEDLARSIGKAVAGDTKLMEAFIGRLSDINGKVSLEAMDTYLATLPSMAKLYSGEAGLKAVLNQLLLALSSHLPSKSDEHRQLAQKCLSETVRLIDGSALSPAVAAAARKANVKQRPFMLHVFSTLNDTLYRTKPKQVEIQALPILIDTIRTPPADAENKKAAHDFARSLAKLMGERGLLDAVGGGLDPAKKQQLETIIRQR
ncbi:unnamed protein product, partial [Mesorhabditis spiculigera]